MTDINVIAGIIKNKNKNKKQQHQFLSLIAPCSHICGLWIAISVILAQIYMSNIASMILVSIFSHRLTKSSSQSILFNVWQPIQNKNSA